MTDKLKEDIDRVTEFAHSLGNDELWNLLYPMLRDAFLECTLRMSLTPEEREERKTSLLKIDQEEFLKLAKKAGWELK